MVAGKNRNHPENKRNPGKKGFVARIEIQMTDDGRQMSEVRRHITEDGRQISLIAD